MNSFETPILLTAFNRPDTTQKVFDEIRKLHPKQFFFAVDGPRKDKTDEDTLCRQVRDIVKQIDWDCEVKILFREENLGCGYGMYGAISWFFDHVDEGIILEDDCVPDQSFFYFCRELLEKYKDNEKILMIGGNNFQEGRHRGKGSYYFSIFPLLWGWASWRRAWKNAYDFTLTSLEKRKLDWGYQWILSVRKARGLIILPNVNLVENIGFRSDATHTTHIIKELSKPAECMSFPLIHPKHMYRNLVADLLTHRTQFGGSIKTFVAQELVYYSPSSIKSHVEFFIKRIRNLAGKI